MPPLSVEHLLAEREATGRPVRVGLVGAGVTGRAIALQLVGAVPGLHLAAIANRTLEHARRAYGEAGAPEPITADDPAALDRAVEAGRPVISGDPGVLTRAAVLDVIVEATGTVEHAARVVLDALVNRKHVVLVNAELDATLGPILAARAAAAGVVLTHTDGDEPGVAMTLLRYLRTVGLRPVAAGNLKGLVDHYRTPETQRAFAEQYAQDARKVTSFADATKLSMEATILANATGFRVGRRGMYGPRCEHVSELAGLLPSEDLLRGGLVDYALGAAPHTGAFVIVHEPHPEKRRHLAYYKLGPGPFYVFHTPYHLPHIQVISSIARAVLLNDPTVVAKGAPVCETITVAKRDLRAGEVLDGVGGFCAYGLIENTAEARAERALPMGLCEGCRLTREVRRDATVRLDDVERPRERLADQLWDEQLARFSGAA